MLDCFYLSQATTNGSVLPLLAHCELAQARRYVNVGFAVFSFLPSGFEDSPLRSIRAFFGDFFQGLGFRVLGLTV